MAWTTPRTWVTGELVTAALLNTHIKDNLAYLKNSPDFDGSITVAGSAKVGGTGAGSPATNDIRASGSSILSVYSTDAYNTPPKAQLLFGTKYTSGGTLTNGPYIEGGKENATDSNYSYYLALGTRLSGSAAAEAMRITSAKHVGIGTTAPQGRLHAYDTIGGCLFWIYDGVDGTTRTIIPDGTGDVLYSLIVSYVTRSSAGTVEEGFYGVGITPGTTFDLVSIAGPHVLRLEVTAAGAVTIYRQSGDRTYKVALWLQWL